MSTYELPLPIYQVKQTANCNFRLVTTPQRWNLHYILYKIETNDGNISIYTKKCKVSCDQYWQYTK